MAGGLPDYEIRQMRKGDIPAILDLWREETSDQAEGTHCVHTWFEYDPEGFYVAVTNDGTVIGVCAGVLQTDDFAFIGMYAVKSTFQRRGIGRKIWNKVMERLGSRNAGLNTVPEMLENYRDKAGFPIQSDFCSVVCVAQEVLTGEMTTHMQEIDVCVLLPDEIEKVDAVAEYDSDVLGFHRGRLISILCREEDSVTVVATKLHDKSICGFGTIKESIRGNALVGPLFADDDSIAELILYHLIKAFPVAESKGVILTPVNCNKVSMAMVEKLGFHKMPGTARLYRSEEIDVKFEKVFAQHNLNFSVF